jgi:hypothetical protein
MSFVSEDTAIEAIQLSVSFYSGITVLNSLSIAPVIARGNRANFTKKSNGRAGMGGN